MTELTWRAPSQRALGLCELALEHHDEAARHLEAALSACERAGAQSWSGWLCLELASAYASGGPSNAGRIAELLARARELADRLDAPGLNLAVEGWASKHGDKVHAHTTPKAVIGEFEVRIEAEGEYFRFQWAARGRTSEVFRLKETKGIRWLAELVAQPRRPFHVLELVGSEAGQAVDGGSSGLTIDVEARDAYRARARDIQAELEEARAWNDPARVDKLEAELEAIAAELSRALGIGGKPRRASDAVERARINVQRRLRDAIRRVEKHDTALARHLSAALKTGVQCSYDPP
jgi:hypothetical protein